MKHELKFADPVLHKTAVEIPKGERKVSLIMDMIQIMKYHRGVGLAAPQVGISQRLIVLRLGDDAQEIINPIITKRYGSFKKQCESCLSFPNQQIKIKRYSRINIEGFDMDWKPVRLKLRGNDARCAQHEVDHLNGITIV